MTPRRGHQDTRDKPSCLGLGTQSSGGRHCGCSDCAYSSPKETCSRHACRDCRASRYRGEGRGSNPVFARTPKGRSPDSRGTSDPSFRLPGSETAAQDVASSLVTSPVSARQRIADFWPGIADHVASCFARAQWSEASANLVGEELRLFPSRKVAASL